MTPLRFLFATAACSAAAFVFAAEPAHWPHWGGPDRDFVVRSATLADTWPDGGPAEIWRRDLGAGDSTIVSDGERLFTLYRKKDLNVAVALDAASGDTLWEHSWSAPDEAFMVLDYGSPLHSTPALNNDTLFAIGGSGRLVALDKATGELRWHRELWKDLDGTRVERGYAASPLVYRNLVITPVGGSAGALVALSVDSGEIVWRSVRSEAAYASPILIRVEGREQIVALLDEEILSVEPASGDRLWRHPLRRYRYVNTATPLHDGRGRLLVVTSDGSRLLRVRPAGDGFEIEDVWVERAIGSQVGNAILFDGNLYGVKGGATSFMVSVDLETGRQNWRDRSIGDSNLVLAGDRLIVLEDGGRLSLVEPSPEELRVVSSAQVLSGRVWSAPTLVGDRLYLRDRREIVALDLSGPPM